MAEDLTEVRIELADHSSQIKMLDRRVELLEKRDELLTDIRIELGKLQSQIKITWALLFLVISGLIGVAFSIWSVGP